MLADTDLNARTLVLSRVFDAPRETLFQAWTTPRQVAAWWGPLGYVTTHCDMDIRPGGAFRVCMRSPEGVDHWKLGRYQDIVPPERIVFTFAWADACGAPGHQTLVTITFDDLGTRTRLTLRQAVFESVEWRDSHHTGWSSCLDRFDRWLVNREIWREQP